MNHQKQLRTKEERHVFWTRMIESLADVYDAHGVCAAIARLISDYFEATVIVALDEPTLEEHDIWISRPGNAFYQTRWHRCDDLLAYLGEADGPIVFDISDQTLARFCSSEVWSFASTQIAAAPIPNPSASSMVFPYGAIFVIDPQEDVDFDLDHLGFIAAQVSVYIDRAALRLRTDRQEVEFGLVSDIGSTITSSLDMKTIASEVSDAARRAIGCEQIRIALLDQMGKRLIFIHDLLESRFRNMPEAYTELGHGIAGWVAKRGEPVIANDVYSDDRFFSSYDSDSVSHTKSILCVPLTMEDQVIGVLEAVNKMRGDFDAIDLRLLEAITGPLAIAIKNAQLHASVVAEKRRVETIFTSMSEGLLTTDKDGTITAVNDALGKLIGKNPADLVGTHLIDSIETEQPGFKEFGDLVAMNQKPFQQLICDIANSTEGFVPVIISGACIQKDDDEINGLVFVFSDLTEIREIERMRDDFFNNIVHELHTPLATILMYARLLLQDKAPEDEEKTHRFLQTIEVESNRLQRLVRQMLHLAKIQAAEQHTVEDTSQPNLVLNQLLPPLQEIARAKGIDFEIEIDPKLPAVQGDEETLYMIVKNLVDNAIKFTLDGRVLVRAYADDEWVTIEVKDDGIGIPPEGMPNLFSRFYRAQTAVERGIGGTGLGLYMVKEGLDYCGGTIDVTSTVGVGTEIVIRMVVADT